MNPDDQLQLKDFQQSSILDLVFNLGFVFNSWAPTSRSNFFHLSVRVSVTRFYIQRSARPVFKVRD